MDRKFNFPLPIGLSLSKGVSVVKGLQAGGWPWLPPYLQPLVPFFSEAMPGIVLATIPQGLGARAALWGGSSRQAHTGSVPP